MSEDQGRRASGTRGSEGEREDAWADVRGGRIADVLRGAGPEEGQGVALDPRGDEIVPPTALVAAAAGTPEAIRGPTTWPWLSWLVIIASTLTVMALTLGERSESPELDEQATSQTIRMQARVLLVQDSIGPTPDLSGLDELATTPRLVREVAVVMAALDQGDGARVAEARRELLRIHTQRARGARDDAPDSFDELLGRALATPLELDAADRATLLDELGWFAELLLVRDLADDDPAKVALLAHARRSATLSGSIILLMVGGAMAGAALLVVGNRRRIAGVLRLGIAPKLCGTAIYLEAFAVYLFVFAAAAAASRLWPGGMLLPLVGTVGGAIAGMVWPMARGVPWAVARRDLGLHGGEGVVKELGAGLVGYCMLLPFFAVGVGLMLATEAIAGAVLSGDGLTRPYHPEVVGLGDSGPLGLLVLLGLAGVFAPVVEETMFRGALQRGLRRRLGMVSAVLVMAVIFAALHPQGLLALPALAALAVGFGMLREWRDSLIAPMVAHGLHNGSLLLVTALMMW